MKDRKGQAAAMLIFFALLFVAMTAAAEITTVTAEPTPVHIETGSWSAYQTGVAGIPDEGDWARAGRSIRRLPPVAFPHLPHGIQDWLAVRGFTIPQTYDDSLDGPHNVVSGAFERHGSLDWACLGSRGDSSAILVFFSGSVDRPIELAWSRDRSWLQTVLPDSIGYSRVVSLADSARICEGFVRDGLRLPVPVTHDGIEIGFFGKGSVILYYVNGEWRPMGGSD